MNVFERLQELARLFLRLGAIGFGGPQAHIAMIYDEVVVRRGWFTEAEFLEGVAVCEMLPGPASTQVGIYTGYMRAGNLGALVAGFCFIFPAFIIVLLLSWAYFRFQGLAQIDDLFLGMSPVVIAIIFGFCWKLGKKGIKDKKGVGIAIAVLLVTILFQVNILLQFLIAGLVGILCYKPRQDNLMGLFPLLPIIEGLPQTLAVLPSETLAVSSIWGLERIGEYFTPLTLFFLKVGSFIFGGGLVIVPLLESEIVNQLQWLTQNEFLDGVAIGELTPGPVTIIAAFVGYKVAGIFGALVATIAIFTPSFLFIMSAAPFLKRIRQSPWVQSFLKGVTPAVLGAIAAAAIPLAQSAIMQETLGRSILAVIIIISALTALVRYKRPAWQLVAGGAMVGLVIGTLS